MADRERNAAVVRRALAAVDHRDVTTLQGLLHPDIKWHDLGSNNPLGGTYEGVGAVMTFFAKTFEMTGDTLHIALHDVTSSEGHVVALVRLTGRREGKSLDDKSLFVVHVKDDKVFEVYSYAEDQPSTDDFWS